ncbi:MAG TPA: SDR family oxidoreductase [Dehalococcoidia bacterium]|nr:SDR family oxidoreductase [Dehalococcoidia bacterium]
MQSKPHSLFDLSDKVAIVTGGGSGLGREFCDVLAEYGADVVCPDLYKERADETCKIIEKYGHRTLPLQSDLSRYDQVRDMFRKVMDNFGRVDILVNNAGISARPARISEVDLDDWHNVINIDLHGVFYCMREGLKIMIEQKSGNIINIASVLGIMVTPPSVLSVPPYVAAKFAVVGLTKEAAGEYGEYGIRVNCIAPGFHHGTRLGGKEIPQTPQPKPSEASPGVIERTPLGRTASPEELKGLLLYLASDSSSFMTGQIIAHDGGLSVW